MTIAECKLKFEEELSQRYTRTESSLLCSIFLEKYTGLSSIQQKINEKQPLEKAEIEKITNGLSLLKTGKPYQYILGEAFFFGLPFLVNENVLIPRPETEELLEFAISKIKSYKNKTPRILDIGTGSGIIPITLKKHFPNAEVFAIDISKKALQIAEQNAEKHQTKIQFQQMDILNDVLKESFDIIISNPPYIGKDEEPEIEGNVKNFEPLLALFSPNKDPLIFYRKIAEITEKQLHENGLIFLEINQKLGQETLQLFQHFPIAELRKDWSGNDRIIFVQKKRINNEQGNNP